MGKVIDISKCMALARCMNELYEDGAISCDPYWDGKKNVPGVQLTSEAFGLTFGDRKFQRCHHSDNRDELSISIGDVKFMTLINKHCREFKDGKWI